MVSEDNNVPSLHKERMLKKEVFFIKSTAARNALIDGVDFKLLK